MPQSLPLQARLGLLFPFLPFFFPPVLSSAWMGLLSLIQVCRCPGFVHNWLTRAQQGLSGASVVSFPYLAVKTAHRATQGQVWIFFLERVYPSP